MLFLFQQPAVPGGHDLDPCARGEGVWPGRLPSGVRGHPSAGRHAVLRAHWAGPRTRILLPVEVGAAYGLEKIRIRMIKLCRIHIFSY